MKRKNRKRESVEQRHKRYLAIYLFEYFKYFNDLWVNEASPDDFDLWPKRMPANWKPKRPAMSLKQAKKAFARESQRYDDLRYKAFKDELDEYGPLGP